MNSGPTVCCSGWRLTGAVRADGTCEHPCEERCTQRWTGGEAGRAPIHLQGASPICFPPTMRSAQQRAMLLYTVLLLNIEESEHIFLGAEGVFVGYLGASSTLTALQKLAPVR